MRAPFLSTAMKVSRQ